MLSYWESVSFIKYDLIIVGSGIVGLSTAIKYKKKHPNTTIAILERGVFPSGASTKNAGFACFGSISELEDDLKECNEDEIVALTEKRYRGIRELRKLLGDEAIQFEPVGGFELGFDHSACDRIEYYNGLLEKVFPQAPFSEVTKDLKNYPFSKEVTHLIKHQFEGTIHTGKMMSSLIDLALELGIRIYTGCEVKHIEFDTNPVRISTVTNQQSVEFRATQIALCTNAFTSSLLPDLDLEPGRGQVLITKPIHNLNLKGSFHYHSGYHYFRPIDNRILIGGGRQLDKPGETSLAFAPNDTILNQLKEDLQRLILPGLEVSIESNWAGIMAFGKSKNPIVKKASENVFVAARLGGMGIAIGAGVADDLITLLESQ